MTEYEKQPSGEAQQLLSSPLLNEILGAIEHGALESIINSKDEETRMLNIWQVRSIRDLRAQLKTLAEGKTKRPSKRSVA